MGEPQKDFLALTHGEEWVNFYESFDKLVQDNLSRSSDLLKRAMTLPEVADREVAKVKDELENRLAAERAQQRAVLTELRDEVTGSQRQISTLTRSMGGLLADLERLSGRISSALAVVDEHAGAPAAPQTAPVSSVNPQTSPAASSELDLNALADAETEKPAEAAPAQEFVAATNGAGERQRPHWLSVTRPGSPGNN